MAQSHKVPSWRSLSMSHTLLEVAQIILPSGVCWIGVLLVFAGLVYSVHCCTAYAHYRAIFGLPSRSASFLRTQPEKKSLNSFAQSCLFSILQSEATRPVRFFAKKIRQDEPLTDTKCGPSMGCRKILLIFWWYLLMLVIGIRRSCVVSFIGVRVSLQWPNSML